MGTNTGNGLVAIGITLAGAGIVFMITSGLAFAGLLAVGLVILVLGLRYRVRPEPPRLPRHDRNPPVT